MEDKYDMEAFPRFKFWSEELDRFVQPTKVEMCVNSFIIQEVYDNKTGNHYTGHAASRILLLQNTGLKDKNNKYIYVGDILSDGEDGGIVTWCNELSCYKLETSDGDYLDDYLSEYLDRKIVGNKYEDKETFIGDALVSGDEQ